MAISRWRKLLTPMDLEVGAGVCNVYFSFRGDFLIALQTLYLGVTIMQFAVHMSSLSLCGFGQLTKGFILTVSIHKFQKKII